MNRGDWMDKLQCGAVNRFYVFKREDIKRCNPTLQKTIYLAALSISANRASQGKNPNPEYLVINTDEPYVSEIIDILKRNGHWG